MDVSFSAEEQKRFAQFSSLKSLIDKKRSKKLARRLMTNPYSTRQEYLMGAFIEMYEHQLQPVVFPLFKKGYTIEVSSGFSGKYGECQVIKGYFPISEQIKNRLGKVGVKIHDSTYHKTMSFYPKRANLEAITASWKQIAEIFPDKEQASTPSTAMGAFQFRLAYIPVDPLLKIHRLFECLRDTVKQNMAADLTYRLKTKPFLSELESRLGVFLEMLEPQVRDAVVLLNRKGYSTDTSGFMAQADGQMIEGDFTIDEQTLNKLKAMGVTVETNPSGYTRLEFRSDVADIDHVRNQWKRIVELFPDRKKQAQPSMTKKSRDIRSKYARKSAPST
ncbi:hypothetical protein HY008_00205 [Candidatus Woesebacteria bacterium]|nr:hypothetical protein [Candidatus Woesebacteria bacterium]